MRAPRRFIVLLGIGLATIPVAAQAASLERYFAAADNGAGAKLFIDQTPS